MPIGLRTTGKAAKEAGISRATLQEWIAAKKIQAPGLIGGVRLWANADVERLKRVKKAIYQEGHPRKPRRRR